MLVGAVIDLKTAPSFILLGRGRSPDSVRWTEKDKILALAVHALEKELCPSCGIPKWHGHSADSAIEIAVEWRVCYGCQELEKARANTKHQPGEFPVVHAYAEEGLELPSREAGYANTSKPLYESSEGSSGARPTGPRGIND